MKTKSNALNDINSEVAVVFKALKDVAVWLTMVQESEFIEMHFTLYGCTGTNAFS